MEVRSVSACGILSFEEFHLDLNSQLTLIVGPNGAGKSNLGRLLEVVMAAIERSEQDNSRHEKDFGSIPERASEQTR